MRATSRRSSASRRCQHAIASAVPPGWAAWSSVDMRGLACRALCRAPAGKRCEKPGVLPVFKTGAFNHSATPPAPILAGTGRRATDRAIVPIVARKRQPGPNRSAGARPPSLLPPLYPIDGRAVDYCRCSQAA